MNIEYGKPKKLSCLEAIYVTFDYDVDKVNTIRAYPDRYYHAKIKTWELPIEAVPYLEKRFEVNFLNEPPKIEKKEVQVYELPKLKTELYNFQKEDYQVLMNHDKYLLLNSMGLGKALSGMSVALGRQKYNNIDHCLVIVGVNGIKYNWEREVKQHSYSTVAILGQTYKRTISTEDKLKHLDNLDTFFIVTNVESLRNKEILAKLKKLKNIMVIFDELHTCKDAGSQQGKALMQLVKGVKYFLGMTGTPIMNSPLDAYVPLKLVGREVSSKYQFIARYCILGGWGGYSIVEFRNLEELQNKIDMVSIRRLKEDILDLPPKVLMEEYVELPPAQRRVYENMKRAILQDIDPKMMAVDPLGQMIRLRQATAFTDIVSDTVNESAKAKRLLELLEETQGKVVVFSQWTKVTDRLYPLLKKYNPAIYTGKTDDREEQLKKFKTDPTCKVILGTVGALGTGLTLTEAETSIFLDTPWTYAIFEQAQDRIYRIGTRESVNIISLIAKNTIDEYIYNLVKKKKGIADTLIDKKYDITNPKIQEYLITGNEELLGD